jgi:hypothetical protein
MSTTLIFALSALGVNVYKVDDPLPVVVQDPPTVALVVTWMLLCCAKTTEEKSNKKELRQKILFKREPLPRLKNTPRHFLLKQGSGLKKSGKWICDLLNATN